MEIEEYGRMFELEEKHWWYKGLHDLIFSSIEELYPYQKNLNILDSGCGTGFILKWLNKFDLPFGIDISETALEYCKKRDLRCITRASVLELPFSDESFDLIISADVFYHKAVKDDIRAINETYRVLKNKGYLIVNVPANNYLWRSHDNMVHTQHRYAKDELCTKLTANRFKVMKISYRSMILLPIVLLLKLVNNKREKDMCRSDLKYVLGPFNSFLFYLLKIENLLLKQVDIPFGTSIFCISRKIIE